MLQWRIWKERKEGRNKRHSKNLMIIFVSFRFVLVFVDTGRNRCSDVLEAVGLTSQIKLKIIIIKDKH